jgi:hypothetical protein
VRASASTSAQLMACGWYSRRLHSTAQYSTAQQAEPRYVRSLNHDLTGATTSQSDRGAAQDCAVLLLYGATAAVACRAAAAVVLVSPTIVLKEGLSGEQSYDLMHVEGGHYAAGLITVQGKPC